jgi:hypothetical protein
MFGFLSEITKDLEVLFTVPSSERRFDPFEINRGRPRRDRVAAKKS